MTSLRLILTLGIISSLLVLKSETKNTCTYSFTVENADLRCGGGQSGIKTLEEGEKKANQVGYSWDGFNHLEGRGGGGHRRHGGVGHKSRHHEKMASDQSLSGDDVINKLLLTVNKLLQHQNVLDNVKVS